MKLMMFEHGGSTKLGSVVGDEVVDLKSADSSLPANILGMIEGVDAALTKAKAAADAAPDSCKIPIADAKPARPIERPEKFFLHWIELCPACQRGRARHPNISVNVHPRAKVYHSGRCRRHQAKES